MEYSSISYLLNYFIQSVRQTARQSVTQSLNSYCIFFRTSCDGVCDDGDDDDGDVSVGRMVWVRVSLVCMTNQMTTMNWILVL